MGICSRRRKKVIKINCNEKKNLQTLCELRLPNAVNIRQLSERDIINTAKHDDSYTINGDS